MPKSCCAVDCKLPYTKDCGVSFHRFPADPDRRRRWIAALNRKDWEPNEYTWLCGRHFISGTKSDDPLDPDFVPSIFSHVSTPMKRKLQSRVSDYHRRKGAKKRRIEATSRQKAVKESREKERKREADKRKKEAERMRLEEVQRERHEAEMEQRRIEQIRLTKELGEQHAAEMARQLEELKAANEVLKETNKALKETNEELQTQCTGMEQQLVEVTKEKNKLEEKVAALSKRVLSEETMKDDAKKVKYYTGLPNFGVLKAIYNLAAKELPESDCLFQQYLMTLIKLRLNVGDLDLAYRFGISQASVSRYIHKWVDILYTRTSFLVHWPERLELMKTMPNDFRKHFRKCAIIIDCFEVFIERPSSLLARAQTYSNYKKHNTVKFLIGITPQGSVAFISKGWGGRVSDVHLTENCGLLKKLLPGDVILADRGFTIQDSAGLYCAEVCIPPFTKGKSQLSKVEIEKARQLSHVRIHVERVIGVVRQKFSILHATLPINVVASCDDDGVSFVDKIVTICCALCNCCDSVVPFD